MIERALVEAEVRFHQLGRRQRQPLVQRHVFESGRPEEFEEFQRYIAGVLNIVAHRLRNIATSPARSGRCGAWGGGCQAGRGGGLEKITTIPTGGCCASDLSNPSTCRPTLFNSDLGGDRFGRQAFTPLCHPPDKCASQADRRRVLPRIPPCGDGTQDSRVSYGSAPPSRRGSGQRTPSSDIHFQGPSD